LNAKVPVSNLEEQHVAERYFMPGGQRLSHLSRKSLKVPLPPGHQMSQLKSLYHSTALELNYLHAIALATPTLQYNTIQYTNNNVAAERSPRAASTSNVEKIEVNHICPSARQQVEKELRSRGFAVGLRGECRKNRGSSHMPFREATCRKGATFPELRSRTPRGV